MVFSMVPSRGKYSAAADKDNDLADGSLDQAASAIMQGMDEEDDSPEENDDSESADSVQPPPDWWPEEEQEVWQALPDAARRVLQRFEQQISQSLDGQRSQMERERQAVAAERNQYISRLNNMLASLAQQIDEEFSGVDWQKLATDNPAEFMQKRARYEARQMRMQQARQEQSYLQQMQQAEEQRRQQDFLAQQASQLRAADDDFRDAGRAKQRVQEIQDFLGGLGFSPAEMGGLCDHRLVLLVRDAMEHRKLKKSRPDITKKVTQPPRLLRPSGGSGPGAQTDARRQGSLKNTLKKTGSVRDAARLLETYL